MDYYASGTGFVTVKDASDVEEVMKLLSNCFKNVERVTPTMIDVWGYDIYHGDELEEVYRKISDKIEDAEIWFSKEGDCHWKHVFSKGIWEELTGKIVYKNPRKIA